MSFGQLIEYNKKNFKHHAENEVERLFPDLSLFLENL